MMPLERFNAHLRNLRIEGIAVDPYRTAGYLLALRNITPTDHASACAPS